MNTLDAQYLGRIVDEKEPLPSDKQKELVRRWQNDDDRDALWDLVLTNLRFVVQTAKEKGSADQYDDLIQAGVVGLLRAANKFDLDRDVTFLSYAKWWMHSEIAKVHQVNRRAAKVSDRDGRTVIQNYHSARKQLQRQGREPTSRAIADLLDVEPRDVEKVTSVLSPVRLSNPIRPESKDPLQNIMQGGYIPQDEMMCESERQLLISEYVREFGESIDKQRNREIWFNYVVAEDPPSLEKLGDQWGISKERVRQIKESLKADFRDFIDQKDVENHVLVDNSPERQKPQIGGL